MEAFLSKVVEEYPTLLVAEVLVLLTIALIGLLFRYLSPLPERYIEIYRSYKLRRLVDEVDYLQDILSNQDLRLRSLVEYGIRTLFMLLIAAISGIFAILGVIAATIAYPEHPYVLQGILAFMQVFLFSGAISIRIASHRFHLFRLCAMAEERYPCLKARLGQLIAFSDLPQR